MTRARPIRLVSGETVPVPWTRPAIWRETLERSVKSAMMQGTPVERSGRRRFRLGWEPKCEAPYIFEAFASRSEIKSGKRDPIFVTGSGRCRKCDQCKKARSAMWQIRAMHEYSKWPVTVFGTVTMSPEEHYALDARIIQGTRGPDGQYKRYPANINEMSATELFVARVGVMGDDVQRLLKRLRKGDAFHRPQFRYLLVAEAHDSDRTNSAMRGRPHFHILLHENVQGSLILGSPTKAILEGQDGEWKRCSYKAGGHWREGVFVDDRSFLRSQWDAGFTKFQFAENAKAAGYLCKYLSKNTDVRIRASVGYGEDTVSSSNDVERAKMDPREHGLRVPIAVQGSM